MSNELDKIEKLDKQIKLLEQKQKALESHLKKNDKRKKRTRRLIQIGALAEKYLPVENMSIEDIELYFKKMSSP